MKSTTFVVLAILLSAGYAFAGGGGGPATVLDDSQCKEAWNEVMGGPPDGQDKLSPERGQKMVPDFQKADADKDGKISKAEFEDACKNGLVVQYSANSIPPSNP